MFEIYFYFGFWKSAFVNIMYFIAILFNPIILNTNKMALPYIFFINYELNLSALSEKFILVTIDFQSHFS